MKIIIRDDDTSFFTSPALLETIYGRLWEHNHPVCLAVIPAQRGDTIVAHRPSTPYDPSIPPRYRGQAQAFPVTENRPLCDFLNQKAREGLVEICLHGYTHAYMEFSSEATTALRTWLIEGKQTLQAAFPDAAIRTFIAPYDVISKPGLELVYELGLSLCTSTTCLQPFEALNGIDAYCGQRLSNGLNLFTCNEYLFTHRDDPADSLAKVRERLRTAKLLILANHYWTFFYDWAEVNPAMLASWDQFVDDILADDANEVTTFSACDVPEFDGRP